MPIMELTRPSAQYASVPSPETRKPAALPRSTSSDELSCDKRGQNRSLPWGRCGVRLGVQGDRSLRVLRVVAPERGHPAGLTSLWSFVITVSGAADVSGVETDKS